MKKIIYFILLLFWLVMIFLLSNQNGEVSGTSSSSIITNILNIIYSLFHLSKHNINDVVGILQNPIRECAHAFEYLVLGFLTFQNLENFSIKGNKYIITFLWGFIYASLDEIHQLFISGRTFQYFDIVIDMLGIILILLMIKEYKNREPIY